MTEQEQAAVDAVNLAAQSLNSAMSAAASQGIEADVQVLNTSVVGQRVQAVRVDVRLSKVLLP